MSYIIKRTNALEEITEYWTGSGWSDDRARAEPMDLDEAARLQQQFGDEDDHFRWVFLIEEK